MAKAQTNNAAEDRSASHSEGDLSVAELQQQAEAAMAELADFHARAGKAEMLSKLLLLTFGRVTDGARLLMRVSSAERLDTMAQAALGATSLDEVFTGKVKRLPKLGKLVSDESLGHAMLTAPEPDGTVKRDKAEAPAPSGTLPTDPRGEGSLKGIEMLTPIASYMLALGKDDAATIEAALDIAQPKTGDKFTHVATDQIAAAAKAAGKLDLLTPLMQDQHGPPPSGITKLMQAATPAQLDAWARRLFKGESLEAIFGKAARR